MMKSDPLSRRQLRSLCAAALLSPALRLIPGSSAALAGRAAWVGPLAALPALLLYGLLLVRIRRALRPGEALPEYALRVLGRRPGRLTALLLAAWLLVYAGFSLRAGADRFLVTVYPRAEASFFVVSMGLLGLLAALGPLRSLARTARIVSPVLLGVLGLILLAALRGLDRSELLPLTVKDAEAILTGTYPALDLLTFGPVILCFFPPAAGEEPGGLRREALWLTALCLLYAALGAAVQGRFGAALCARLSAPFFALVRNLVFFRSLERMEALVVGLWILPDFLLVGMVLQAAQRCLRLGCGCAPREAEGRWTLRDGRWLVWLCGGAAIVLGLLLAPDPPALQRWSRGVIPILNLSGALLIPGVLLAGGKRKKL